jgi:large subunit ribosomal protein L3
MRSKKMIRLQGKKCGMVRVFDKAGAPIGCTLLKMDPNVVSQIKTRAKDGYDAIQLASSEEQANDPRTIEKRLKKPVLGHFKKSGIAPHRHLHETKVEDVNQYEIGKKVDLSVFEGVQFVDVMGISKGKGYQGVMKKYGFSGGPAAHGSGFHRHAGSTGMRSSPGRSLPNSPRPSHMGDERVTVQSLRVVLVDVEKGLLAVEGAVPGAKNGMVIVSQAKKKISKKAKK